MIRMTVEDAARACGGALIGNTGRMEGQTIRRVVIDSRKIQTGDLFVAYKGENTDGHAYVPVAFEKGAAACLISQMPEAAEGPLILVPDVQAALEKIAAACRSDITCPVIGITGSVGKTTAKEMISAVLSAKYNVLKTDGNLNNQIGVPMTLSAVGKEHTAAVVEMGISHFGEMDALGAMVRPDIAVYTVIGHAHLEFLHDLDGVLRAKTEMLRHMRPDATVILNGDDEKQIGVVCEQKKLFYGFRDNCDVRASDVSSDEKGFMHCVIHYKENSFPVVIPAFGRHAVYAALEGASVGLVLGMTTEQIAAGIMSYQICGRRGEITKTKYLTLIDDSYNANPDSVKSSINSLTGLTGRRICILGDMLELGENTAAMHREIGAYAAEKGADLILACGPVSRNLAEGAGGHAVYYETAEKLLAELDHFICSGDTVLVQASRGMHLEKIADYLKTYVPIDARPFVLMDLDDTILDFHTSEREAVSATFRDLGLEPNDAMLNRYSEINASCWEKLETGEWSREEVLVNRFCMLFEEVGCDASGLAARNIYEERLKNGFYVLPGAIDLLNTLSGKYRLIIVSNGTAAVQNSRLDGTGIRHYFEKIFISEYVGYNKPDKAFFDISLAQIPDFCAGRAVLFGDSLTSDILGGIRAGIRTIWYNPKHKTGRADIVPSYEIGALEDLPALLENIFA